MEKELEQLRSDLRVLLMGIVDLVHDAGCGTAYCRQQMDHIELLLGKKPLQEHNNTV